MIGLFQIVLPSVPLITDMLPSLNPTTISKVPFWSTSALAGEETFIKTGKYSLGMVIVCGAGK